MYKANHYLNKKLAASMLGIYLCGWAQNGWLDILEDSDAETMEHFRYRTQHFRELYEWFNCE